MSGKFAAKDYVMGRPGYDPGAKERRPWDVGKKPGAKRALKPPLDRSLEFDAAFSDVVMPGMNGLDLGRKIRSLYPSLPVILTSGYSDVLADDTRHGFELLQKPNAIENLSQSSAR